jgi:hypothetical protein
MSTIDLIRYAAWTIYVLFVLACAYTENRE